MFCPQCGKENKAESVFCFNCGNNLQGGATIIPEKIKEANTKVQQKKKSNKAVVVLLAVALFVVLALSIIAGVVIFKVVNSFEGKNIVEEESTVVATVAEAAVAEVETGIEGDPLLITGVDFYDLVAYPTYTRTTNYKYSYYCDVPDNFIQYEFGDTQSYVADDNTAIMKLAARNNYEGYTAKDVMNMRIEELGGYVHYSATKKDWFALSIIADDGMCYYIKGFADEYVREFIFYFPEEYLENYNDYIEHIEDNFKCTE